jgi:hypothetical protein
MLQTTPLHHRRGSLTYADTPFWVQRKHGVTYNMGSNVNSLRPDDRPVTP